MHCLILGCAVILVVRFMNSFILSILLGNFLFISLGPLSKMKMALKDNSNGSFISLQTEYSTLAVAVRCNTAAAFGSVAAADFHYVTRSDLFSR